MFIAYLETAESNLMMNMRGEPTNQSMLSWILQETTTKKHMNVREKKDSFRNKLEALNINQGNTHLSN